MQRAWLRLCAAVAVVGCLAGPSVAQEFRATVTITNTQTSAVTSVTTSENGAYSVPFLRPGVYTLRAEKPDHKLDQYGFQIDGPVIRNKLFFMFNYEGYDESTPNPATLTVPRPEFLSGDFSNLRDAQGRLITIYDPLSGRVVNGQWVRDPFPNNRIPANPINPVSAQVAQYFLQPNTAPTSGNPWQGNYFFGPNLAIDDFYNIATKVDTNVSDRTKMYVRYG
ncbi:carboxypeptidase-like regulatory domain-containing protein [Luteitalea sp.]|uniref:carboxypeptidase-like regulatory domain-containing protein n=1 Tax=Luteitalea sp. TaxID=2004800 RepID=UPI0025BE26DE|nr:carboxypeptidase-like regulatory domain-containing protein [Luteitalea sp.]